MHERNHFAQNYRGTAPLRQKDVREREMRLPFQRGVSLYGQAGLQTQLARVSAPPRVANGTRCLARETPVVRKTAAAQHPFARKTCAR